MVFEGLSQRLQQTLDNLRGKGVLTEKDIDAATREVKLALLEADVDYKVVKSFTKELKEKTLGQEVMKSLTPGQQVIKIVHQQLKDLMGGGQAKINFSSSSVTVIMMVGLQGAGKTTTSAKLANNIKKQGKNPMLVACDVYRPAAIDQLEILAKKIDVKFYADRDSKKPVEIAKKALEEAKTLGFSTMIVDTAGRLHVDEDMMEELEEMKAALRPHEIMLVVDSMTGQDTVNIVKSFDDKLGIDGVVLTKLDGDTRGGAALSIKATTEKPIKFMATGEKMEDLQPFHPERMASRILGMGDVLSLIEKAEDAMDIKDAKKLEEKLRKQEFDLEDFLEQMQQMKKMGPLSNLISMIPGLSSAKQLQNIEVDDKQVARVEAIILSMTKTERKDPDIINASRKKRIASGSGTKVSEVNRLLNQFKDMKKMMKTFMKQGKRKGGFGKFPFMGM